MNFSKKINVCVIYGGRSGEHEISLQSGYAVIQHLDKKKFNVIPIAIDKQGKWLFNELKSLPHHALPSTVAEATKVLSGPYDLIEADVVGCDVVFPVLHGPYGEDGTIQGLFEILNIPYVGANVLGSAVGMDKVIAKTLVASQNIPIVPFLSFNEGQWKNNRSKYLQEINETLGYPLFVKPANAGSSLGVSKVKTELDLDAAITLSFQYDTKILLEKALSVKEIEVAVLENLNFGELPLVSTLGEIIPHHEFYSYEAKYLDENGAQLIIPANILGEIADQIKDYAQKIFVGLACEGMARIDFFVEKTTQHIYFNEINTIPGFTKISMYPKLWNASGLNYSQLLTHLIELALARHQRKLKLK